VSALELQNKFVGTVLNILTEKLNKSVARKTMYVYDVEKSEGDELLNMVLNEFIAMLAIRVAKGTKVEDPEFGEILVIVTNPKLDPIGRERILVVNDKYVVYIE